MFILVTGTVRYGTDTVPYGTVHGTVHRKGYSTVRYGAAQPYYKERTGTALLYFEITYV